MLTNTFWVLTNEHEKEEEPIEEPLEIEEWMKEFKAFSIADKYLQCDLE